MLSERPTLRRSRQRLKARNADHLVVASLLHKSLAWLRVPSNSLSYQLRTRLRWSRGAPNLGNESKDALFGWLADAERQTAERREQQLRDRYELQSLRLRSKVLHYLENLGWLDTLEPLFAALELPRGEDHVLRAVDVGCGVFQYATALHRTLARSGRGAPRRVVLRGIEVDGHGVYRDFHSRADHARAHAALASTDVSFEVADFLQRRLPQQDVVTMLFPFLTSYPLLRWGLPIGLHRPRRMLQHAVETLREGGMLVVVNQTDAEYARLCALLADQPVKRICTRVMATPLVPYAATTVDRRASVWLRCPN